VSLTRYPAPPLCCLLCDLEVLPCRSLSMLIVIDIGHARLKDHVSGMDGGLEAKINEGGKSQYRVPCPSTSTPTTAMYAMAALGIGSVTSPVITASCHVASAGCR
jgi:hypothetical protein